MTHTPASGELPLELTTTPSMKLSVDDGFPAIREPPPSVSKDTRANASIKSVLFIGHPVTKHVFWIFVAAIRIQFPSARETPRPAVQNIYFNANWMSRGPTEVAVINPKFAALT